MHPVMLSHLVFLGRGWSSILTLFRMVWNREPEVKDVEGALAYIGKYPAGAKGPSAAWSSFCRVLMSANQFHYID